MGHRRSTDERADKDPQLNADQFRIYVAYMVGFFIVATVLTLGSLFGVIGAIIGVPTAAALQIVAEELTADRRARVAAADAGGIG